MKTVNHYTFGFSKSVTPAPRFSLREHVMIHDNPDARELDDFRDALSRNGMDVGDFVRYYPRKRMSQYALRKADCFFISNGGAK